MSNNSKRETRVQSFTSIFMTYYEAAVLKKK